MARRFCLAFAFGLQSLGRIGDGGYDDGPADSECDDGVEDLYVSDTELEHIGETAACLSATVGPPRALLLCVVPVCTYLK